MMPDRHDSFQRMIDESLAGSLSSGNQQSLREHLGTCAPCQEYLAANNRVIAGLSGFSLELDPTLNASVLAALRLQVQPPHPGHPGTAQPRRRQFIRLQTVSVKVWAAFAVALSMSIAGSALVYRLATLLMVPMHFETSQLQTGVLVFWLLPSLCAASCLLAAPGQKKGMA